MFVINISEKLFEGIFHGDQPNGSSFCVPRGGDALLRAPKFLQQLGHAQRFGHEGDGQNKLGERFRFAKKLVDVDIAAHPVKAAAAGDEDSGEAAFQKNSAQLDA